jgi:Ca-activated chloride channel family protein
VLVNEFSSTLFTIAKDVKIQVEFNPAKVQAYRLVGYENRLLAAEDFNDDQKDAGELGSGHTVTALYEIIPIGVKDHFTKRIDSLKYQSNSRAATGSTTNEVLTIKLRYKTPDEKTSKLITHPVMDDLVSLECTSSNFRFSAAVAEFGLLLRQSQFLQNGNFEQARSLAKSALETDRNGYRTEFLQLLEAAQTLTKNTAKIKQLQ